MASAAKPARKKFRVAVSGATVDGREIRPEHLRDAAANYSPDVRRTRQRGALPFAVPRQ
jgi:hypothetical protein